MKITPYSKNIWFILGLYTRRVFVILEEIIVKARSFSHRFNASSNCEIFYFKTKDLFRNKTFE